MSFFRDISISGAGGDFINYIRQDREYNWVFWLIACIPPAAMFVMFQLDAAKKSTPPPRGPIYIQSWSADRSLEDTLRAQVQLQKRKDEFARKQRESYKALGRASGMDVEAIEREAAAEKAAAAKAEAAAAQSENAAEGSAQ